MAPHDSAKPVSDETRLNTPEMRLLAVMPLHAITAIHGEDGLRDRLVIEIGRFPAAERDRVDAALTPAHVSQLYGVDVDLVEVRGRRVFVAAEGDQALNTTRPSARTS